jgi:hypothetical protein
MVQMSAAPPVPSRPSVIRLPSGKNDAASQLVLTP